MVNSNEITGVNQALHFSRSDSMRSGVHPASRSALSVKESSSSLLPLSGGCTAVTVAATEAFPLMTGTVVVGGGGGGGGGAGRVCMRLASRLCVWGSRTRSQW